MGALIPGKCAVRSFLEVFESIIQVAIGNQDGTPGMTKEFKRGKSDNVGYAGNTQQAEQVDTIQETYAAVCSCWQQGCFEGTSFEVSTVPSAPPVRAARMVVSAGDLMAAPATPHSLEG